MPILARPKHAKPLGGIYIRPAAVEDVSLLWEWANDSATRKNSLNPQYIPWNVHQLWYAQKLASPDCRLWIMDLDKTPVGQVRYDRVNYNTAQISFSVAPLARRKGLGTLLLEITIPMAARELKVQSIKGIALIDNHASQRVFAKAYFNVTEHQRISDRECVVFQRSWCLKPLAE